MAGASQPTGPLFTCPGCKEAVTGTVSVEFSLDPDATPSPDGTVVATAVVSGLKVLHDCVPKVKRKHRATRTADADAAQV